jgi:hypothetical protein
MTATSVALNERIDQTFQPLHAPTGYAEPLRHFLYRRHRRCDHRASRMLHGFTVLWRPSTRQCQGSDIPVPASVVAYLLTYTKEVLPKIAGHVTPETPLFWSKWSRRVVGRTMQPMTGKNLWRLTKYYGRSIGVPELKPHDLRHGVAMEMYGEHGDLDTLMAEQRPDLFGDEGESDVERGDENRAACLRTVPGFRSERP